MSTAINFVKTMHSFFFQTRVFGFIIPFAYYCFNKITRLDGQECEHGLEYVRENTAQLRSL